MWTPWNTIKECPNTCVVKPFRLQTRSCPGNNILDCVVDSKALNDSNIVECESNANVKKRCDLNSTRDKIINEIKTIEEANLKELAITMKVYYLN